MHMRCVCCHVEGGLHTPDCSRAYKLAYSKAFLLAADECKRLGENFHEQGHSVWQIAADKCAELCRKLSIPSENAAASPTGDRRDH